MGFINRIRAVFVNIILEIIKIFLAILLLAIVPVIILIFIPFFLLRKFVSYLAMVARPDLSKMITATGSILAQDDLYTNPKCNIVVTHTTKGEIPFDLLIEAFAKVIEDKHSNGDLKYPEMKQYPVSWGGFMFWKTQKNFDIQKRFRRYSLEKEIDEKDVVKKLAQQLVKEPWNREQPLWDFTIFHYNGSSEFILKIHHAIGDGYSILGIIHKALEIKINSTSKIQETKDTSCHLSVPRISFPFRCAYETAEYIMKIVNQAVQGIPWKLGQEGFNNGFSEKIPLNIIKEVRSTYEVSFSSVILAAMAGAVRTTMTRKGLKIPETMLTGTILPLPRNELKLRNKLTSCFIALPTGEQDLIKRLQISNKNFNELKRSTFPIVLGVMLPMVGSLCNPLVRLLTRGTLITLAMSNFAAGKKCIMLTEYEVVEVTFTAGLLFGNFGMSFCALSFRDSIRISPVVDEAIMTADEVDELAQEIVKEIYLLRDSILV